MIATRVITAGNTEIFDGYTNKFTEKNAVMLDATHYAISYNDGAKYLSTYVIGATNVEEIDKFTVNSYEGLLNSLIKIDDTHLMLAYNTRLYIWIEVFSIDENFMLTLEEQYVVNTTYTLETAKGATESVGILSQIDLTHYLFVLEGDPVGGTSKVYTFTFLLLIEPWYDEEFQEWYVFYDLEQIYTYAFPYQPNWNGYAYDNLSIFDLQKIDSTRFLLSMRYYSTWRQHVDIPNLSKIYVLSIDGSYEIVHDAIYDSDDCYYCAIGMIGTDKFVTLEEHGVYPLPEEGYYPTSYYQTMSVYSVGIDGTINKLTTYELPADEGEYEETTLFGDRILVMINSAKVYIAYNFIIDYGNSIGFAKTYSINGSNEVSPLATTNYNDAFTDIKIINMSPTNYLLIHNADYYTIYDKVKIS